CSTTCSRSCRARSSLSATSSPRRATHARANSRRSRESGAGARARGRPACGAVGAGYRRERRRVPRDGRPARTLRQRTSDRHAARGNSDRGHERRPRGAGLSARRRSPVHGVHLSDDRSDLEPRVALAESHPRQALVPDGATRAVGRRHSCPRASLRMHRDPVRAHSGAARGSSVLPRARVRLAARSDPRSRSGHFPRADALVPLVQGARSRQRPGAAARRVLSVARRHRRDARELGRGAARDTRGGGRARGRRRERGGDRRGDGRTTRHAYDPRLSRKNRPLRDRARGRAQRRRRRGDRGAARGPGAAHAARAYQARHGLRRGRAARKARASLHAADAAYRRRGPRLAGSRMSVFKLPDLGEGLQEAEISAWHVAPDDEVAIDQPLLAVETAKAIVEIPSPRAGKIKRLFGSPGDILQVGAPLVEFVGQAEDADVAKPAARDAGTVVGRVEKGDEVTRERATPAGRAASAVKATPAVRALARRLDVDLAVVTPSGPNDTVTVRDVERVARVFRELGPLELLRGVRRTMARGMAQAHAEVAPVTVSDDADLAAWWPKGGDLMMRLIRAIAVGCKAEPALNAWFDTHALGRRLLPQIHLGIAVDTPDGLFVPVLRNIGERSADDLAAGLERMRRDTRARTIPPEEMR